MYRAERWPATRLEFRFWFRYGKRSVQSPEQRKALESGESVPVTKSESQLECIVIRADLYERVKALLPGLDPRDTYPAIDEVFREDWSDPKMAEYDKPDCCIIRSSLA